MSGHKCPAKVYAPGAWTPRTCNRAAAFEFDGRWFCKTHHQPTIKAKDEAKQQAFAAKFSAEMARNASIRKAAAEQARRAACFDDLLAALKRLMGGTTTMQDAADANKQARAAIAKAEGAPS